MMTLSQSFFIAKMMGLDKAAQLLARDLFEGAMFVLDTNIIIGALEDYDRFHDAFLALHECFSSLGVDVIAARQTLSEMERWLEYARQQAERVLPGLSPELLAETHGPFVARYLALTEDGQTVDMKDVFANFDSPEIFLSERYGVSIAEDDRFARIFASPEARHVALDMQERAQTFYRHYRSAKSYSRTLHDATALLMVRDLRKETRRQTWFVTMDRSVISYRLQGSDDVQCAIGLEALIQWLFPVVGIKRDDQEFAVGFATLIQQRLLPRKRFFEMEDYIMLESAHVEVRSLGINDARNALNRVHQLRAEHSMDTSEGREALHYEIGKFVHSPDRDLKVENVRLQQQHSEEAAARRVAEETNRVSQASVDKAKAEIERLAREKTDAEGLVRTLRAAEEARQGETIQRAARARLAKRSIAKLMGLGILFIVIEWVVIRLTLKHSSEESQWLAFVSGIAVMAVAWGVIKGFGSVAFSEMDVKTLNWRIFKLLGFNQT